MLEIGLIGGSGLDRWQDGGEPVVSETPFGPPSAVVMAHAVSGSRLLFLPRHGPEHRIPPHAVNYRANLWALREAGAETVLSINAVGGISDRFTPGALVLPDQLIDYTWGRDHSFSDGAAADLQHVDFTQPFSASLGDRIAAAAGRAGVLLNRGGCIGVTQGPRLETAAEIERLRRDGCHLVGMTSMPEAGLARELGLAYASICMVSNRAAGTGDGPLDASAFNTVLAGCGRDVRRIIEELLRAP